MRQHLMPGEPLGLPTSVLFLWVGLGAAISAVASGPTGQIDFDRDIRPIFAENCYTCHGPDENKRKAGLRLDLKEGAFKQLKSDNFAIVPGNVAKSALIERITAQDEDDRMPPLKTGKHLTPQQIDLLRRWIAGGAGWKGHWAYTKPERPPLPDVKNKRWRRNEIDSFVLARLEQENLTPSPEADKRTLARRATLDLTGLPPTPQEVDAFLADKDPQAYEKLVDRLLGSPRYGEQMARYWLDAARYADSHGYHIDSERSMWKYREWVIQAFNRNKPFDQFTIEQLAGDLLTNATTEQKIASGYVRCNMSTGEGGAIVDEYQAKYTFDRVESMSTTWLGLTMTCARCHSHKYDPISQREYYGLYAFFNNIDESIMDGNKPNPDPFIKVPSPKQTMRLGELQKRIKVGEEKLAAPMSELDAEQAAWQRQWHERLTQGWTMLSPSTARSVVTNGAELKILDDHSVLVSGRNLPADEVEVIAPLVEGTLTAVRLETLPHNSLPGTRSGRASNGQFRLGEIEAEMLPPGKDGKPGGPIKLKFTRAVADAQLGEYPIESAIDGKADTGWATSPKEAGQPHSALFILGEPVKVANDSRLRLRLAFAVSKASHVLGHFRLAAGQSDEIVQALNSSRFEPWRVLGPLKSDEAKASLAAVLEPEKKIDFNKSYPGVRGDVKWETKAEFEDGKSHPLVANVNSDHGVRYFYRTLNAPNAGKLEIGLQADGFFKMWVNDQLVLERDHVVEAGDPQASTTVDLKKGQNIFLAKFVTVQGTGPAYFAFNHDVVGLDAIPGEISAMLSVSAEPTGTNAAKLREFFRRQKSPEFKKLSDEVARCRRESEAIEKAIPTTMIAKEMTKPRETVVLIRGEYDKKGDPVSAGVPAVLPPFPKDAPTNRLGLAEWLLDPSNPLTARVTVNRFWQQYFGVGIVKTAEDFGVQGDKPSHPELLDWLATEFERTGWDVKRLQRLIVTSATYRQDSRALRELQAHDPENRLLARGPRFRLDAEEVRDQALFVAGLLVEKTGGCSVKPYQPLGLWEAVSYNNAQKYIPDSGDAEYRRSLYTYWKRQCPPPNMILLDAPSREYCTVRRTRSNTPLQALALLNDPQFVEASRAFAQRVLIEGGKDARQRVAFAFELATARKPAADETRILLDVLQRELKDYRANKVSAEELLGVGDSKPADRLDPRVLAAWTTIASMILNLDETVTKG